MAASGLVLVLIALTACAPGRGEDLIVLSDEGQAGEGQQTTAPAQLPPCGRLAAASTSGAVPTTPAPSLLDPNLCVLLEVPTSNGSEVIDRLRLPDGGSGSVEILELDGGTVSVAEGADGDPALRFPSWSGDETVPRAVVRVLPEIPVEGLDSLEPGEADFVFGASFNQEEPSADAAEPDGDNLIQRGLHTEPSQFKISVDRGIPNCRVAGSAGEVVVTAKAVEPNTWHRVTCARRGDHVVLTVSRLLGADAVLLEEVQGDGPIGEVTWPGTTPVSVGGKVTKEGRIMASETDQFHGIVADPVIAVLASSDG